MTIEKRDLQNLNFEDLCELFMEQQAENERLEAKYKALKKDYDEFYEKEYMARIVECNRLWGELQDIKHLSMFEFADKYCSSEDLEEAGHAFARSLGVGVKMTEAEVAIDEAENAHVPYSGDDF